MKLWPRFKRNMWPSYGILITYRGETFRTRPDWPWGPPCLLYNGYRVSFPGVKRPGRGVDHLTPSSAEVKERVELYLYSPSGPSWAVLGINLPLPLPFYTISRTRRFHISSAYYYAWPFYKGDQLHMSHCIRQIISNTVSGLTTHDTS